MKTIPVIIIAGMMSCSSGGDSRITESDITGTYVREYAFEVSHLETGKKIGLRQIRDSIFVKRSDDGYQVSNRKWRMNDYDQEGWVSMQHAEDRPFPTFFASYDNRLGALTPENSNLINPIVVDKDRLFKGAGKKNAYQRVE